MKLPWSTVDTFFFQAHLHGLPDNVGFIYDLATLKALLHSYRYSCERNSRSFVDLCQFNAAVCEGLKLPSIACMWHVLSTLVEVKFIRQDEEAVHNRSRSIISPTRR